MLAHHLLYLKSKSTVSNKHVNHVTSWVLGVMKSNASAATVSVYVYKHVHVYGESKGYIKNVSKNPFGKGQGLTELSLLA